MYRCEDCGNSETFITEARVYHWVRIDGDGKVQSVDGMQGGAEEEAEQSLSTETYIECGECTSQNIEEGEW